MGEFHNRRAGAVAQEEDAVDMKQGTFGIVLWWVQTLKLLLRITSIVFSIGVFQFRLRDVAFFRFFTVRVIGIFIFVSFRFFIIRVVNVFDRRGADEA